METRERASRRCEPKQRRGTRGLCAGKMDMSGLRGTPALSLFQVSRFFCEARQLVRKSRPTAHELLTCRNDVSDISDQT